MTYADFTLKSVESRFGVTSRTGPLFRGRHPVDVPDWLASLLGRSPDAPEVRSPLAAVVEAKKNDIESGLGQCVAQLIGARIFNEREGLPAEALHGCITTGEIWQFLRLEGPDVLVDTRRYFLVEVSEILGIFQGLFPPPPAA